MAGLLTQVPVDIVGDYFGVPSNDPNFALWLFAMSGASFLAPEDTSDLKQAGLSAAKIMLARWSTKRSFERRRRPRTTIRLSVGS